MNILITGASTFQAYKLCQHLISNDIDKIFLADSFDVPQVSITGREFIKISPGDSPSFAHLLLTRCLDLNIGKIYPLRKHEVLALSEAVKLFEEYGINLIVPDRKQLPAVFETNIKGQILVNEGTEAGNQDKGIFIKVDSTSELKLLIVD